MASRISAKVMNQPGSTHPLPSAFRASEMLVGSRLPLLELLRGARPTPSPPKSTADTDTPKNKRMRAAHGKSSRGLGPGRIWICCSFRRVSRGITATWKASIPASATNA
jgi:hypothetical protein